MAITPEGQRTPTHAHVKQCKSRDTAGEGVEVEVESAATSPNDRKAKRFTFEYPLPSPTPPSQVEEERDVVTEPTTNFAGVTSDGRPVESSDIADEYREALMDFWGGLSPLSSEKIDGNIGGSEAMDALWKMMDMQEAVDIETKLTDEQNSVKVNVFLREDGALTEFQPPQAETTEPEANAPKQADDELDPIIEIVAEDEPFSFGTIEEQAIDLMPSPLALGGSTDEKAEPSPVVVVAQSDPVVHEIAEVLAPAAHQALVKSSTDEGETQDAVMDAWGLSQEQLDKQTQLMTEKRGKTSLEELVLRYDPSLESNLQSVRSRDSIPQSVRNETSERPQKPEGPSPLESGGHSAVEVKTSETRSIVSANPSLVTVKAQNAKASKPAALIPRGDVEYGGSVKDSVALWERMSREVPFDEPPVVSPKAENGKAHYTVLTQTTQEQRNLANMCAATFVDGTHCAPTDTTASSDDEANIVPMASLLDKDDDDSNAVAELDLFTAPTDEQQNDTKSKSGVIATTHSRLKINNLVEVRKNSRTVKPERALSRSKNRLDCGASVIASDVCAYLFSPENTIRGTHLKRNDASTQHMTATTTPKLDGSVTAMEVKSFQNPPRNEAQTNKQHQQ